MYRYLSKFLGRYLDGAQHPKDQCETTFQGTLHVSSVGLNVFQTWDPSAIPGHNLNISKRSNSPLHAGMWQVTVSPVHLEGYIRFIWIWHHAPPYRVLSYFLPRRRCFAAIDYSTSSIRGLFWKELKQRQPLGNTKDSRAALDQLPGTAYLWGNNVGTPFSVR